METLLRPTKGGSGREIMVLHSMNGLMGIGVGLSHKEFMIGLVIRTTELAIRTNRRDCGRMLICTGGWWPARGLSGGVRNNIWSFILPL